MPKHILLVLLVLSFTSCDVYKTLRHGGLPSQNDYKHFTQRIVENESPVYNFYSANKEYQLGEKIGLTNRDLNATNISLDSFAVIHKTKALLIIRNDTILYENYDKKYNQTSSFSSFATVKPFVSSLIGIAIDEGKINSENDFIITYLPQYKSKVGWDKITLKNLLQHTSGIKFTDNPFNPISDNAEFYWSNNLREELMDLELESLPNLKFKDSSANTMLLGLIIEKVTGGTISRNLEEKIWKPLGMEASASWSLDRNDSQAIEKVFCCLQARAIDFAKFGRLYLNNGNWNGKQIISKKWIYNSTHTDATGNNKHFYNNNWGIGPLKYGSYYAIGLYGQFIYVYPEKNIIIIRFGDTDTRYHPSYWQNIFLQIIDQM